MPKYGFAPDHATDRELWNRLASELVVVRLSLEAGDLRSLAQHRLEGCSAIVSELRYRGEQLPLVPQQPVSDAFDAAGRAIRKWVEEGP